MSALPAPTRCRIPTPLRRDLLIVGNGEAILASDFVPPKRIPESKPSDALLAEAGAQVRAYFHAEASTVRSAARVAGHAASARCMASRRVALLRRVRFVRRRRASDRKTARASRRGNRHGTGAARSLHSGASRHRRRRPHQRSRTRARCDCGSPSSSALRLRSGVGRVFDRFF